MTTIGEDARVPPQQTKFTPRIPTSTLERAKRVVAGVHGTEHQVTLNALVDAALRRECARIERVANGGAEFGPYDRMPGAGGRRDRHDATSSADAD